MSAILKTGLLAFVSLSAFGEQPSVKNHVPDGALRVEDVHLESEWLVAERTATFPCDIKAAEKKPKIVIQREIHNTKNALSVQDGLFAKAATGEIFLGLEGWVTPNDPLLPKYLKKVPNFDPAKSTIFGVEDPTSLSLGTLLHDYVEAERTASQWKGRSANRDVGRALVGSLRRVLQMPVLADAWKQVRNEGPFPIEKIKSSDPKDPFLIRSPEEVAKEIDWKLGRYIKEGKYPSPSDLTNGIDVHSEPVKQIYERWIKALIKIVEKDKEKTKSFVPSTLNHLVEQVFSEPQRTKDYQQLLIRWRNLHMAINLAKLYCDALKKNKELHFIVGDAHTKSIRELLEKMGRGEVQVSLGAEPVLKADDLVSPRVNPD